MTVDQQAPLDDVDDAEQETANEQEPAPERPRARRYLARWRLLTLALVTATAVGVAVALFVVQYRPDQQTDDTAAQAAIHTASDGTLALLNYTPDSFDADMADAKTYLTGDFLTYYSKFTDQIMAPAVKERQVKANARLVRAAASELHPTSAVVLLFVDQTTVSRDRQEPSFAASAVRVTLTKVKGAWLISKFEPV